MNVLGVILARGSSQGLKNKHLLPLLGRPVIQYTFDHAEDAQTLTHVVLSSDCPNIRALAVHAGLATIVRPPELATADASVQDALLHALDSTGFPVDAVVVLYGNIPVRGPGVIDRAVRLLAKTGCDSVRSFCAVGKWHPAWMARLDGDRVRPLQAGSIHRRQDLEKLYLHDGAVVAMSRAALLAARNHRDDPHAFFGSDRRGIETAMDETVEIDHQRDLFWAEAVLRLRQAQMSSDEFPASAQQVA